MRKIIGIISIILSIILFIVLQFLDVSVVFSTIMVISLFIGWILPYIGLILEGICILLHSNYYVTLVFSIFNLLLTLIMIFLIIKVYDSKLLGVLMEYIIIEVMNVINIVYLIINRDIIKKDNVISKYVQ